MQRHFYRIGKAMPQGYTAPSPPSYFLGLDLGQRSDYSAIAVVEQPIWVPDYLDTWLRGETAPTSGCYVSPTALTEPPSEFYRRRSDAAKRIREAGERWPNEKRPIAPRVPPVLSLKYLHRWPLGTSYPQIVSDTGDLVLRDPLKGYSQLAIDATGVGAPVVDLFKAGKVAHTAISITGGQQVNRTPYGISVPKLHLASTTQALLMAQRLRFAATLSLLDVLTAELESFEVKINLATGHESFEAWRSGQHDDLVLAVALACWLQTWLSKDNGAFVYRYDTRAPGGGAPPYPLD